MYHLLRECALVLIDRIHDLDGPPPELLGQLHQEEPLIEAVDLVSYVFSPLLRLFVDNLPVVRVEIVFHRGYLVSLVE